MKKITLLVGVVFASLIGTAQTISTFPYNENFEGMTTGTALGNGWTNSTTDNLDWTVDANGTTSSNTGPTSSTGGTINAPDHNPGTIGGQYVYVETSGGAGNGTNIADLVSPYFDMTALTNAKFSFWYHAYGATMGDLDVEARIGSQGVWANILGTITDDVNLWQKGELCLGATYAGNDSVQFRFSYRVGNGFGGDMAIDDISISPINPIDVGVTAISAAGGCG